MRTKEVSKGVAKGDQVCFIFLNGGLDQTSA